MPVRIDRIEDPPSVDGSEGLLALVFVNLVGPFSESPSSGVQFLTDRDALLQVARIEYQSGDYVPPHVHNPVRRATTGTQEFLLVSSGTVELRVFNSAGRLVAGRILLDGDAVLLLGGGHSLTTCSPRARVVEVKTGPYSGREVDKRDLDPR